MIFRRRQQPPRPPGRMRWHRQLRRWARRRQGADSGTVELQSRRVYIVPTRSGLVAGAVLFTMLLGALNYSNNMGFALAFLLTAIAVVSIHHCQRNLAGLRLAVIGGQPVFAGEKLECTVQLFNPGPGPRWQIAVGPDGDTTPVADLAPGETAHLHLHLPTEKRGAVECPEIRVSTVFPLGLFRAWAWLYPDLELLVYPRPAPSATTPRPSLGTEADGSGDAVRGTDDFVGLRGFVPGEPLSRVAWKTLARTGTLLAKDYRSGGGVALLDWDGLPGLSPEQRLSTLTRMLLDARAEGRGFGLRLPGIEIPPGHDAEHGHRCLRALALYLQSEAPQHG